MELTDRQKVELGKAMSDMSGELELIVEFKGKEMTSVSKTATFYTITNVISELSEQMSKSMEVAMEKVGITEKQLRRSLSSEELKEYGKHKFPITLKVKYMGEYMIMTSENILEHQLAQAFDSMSLTIQRGLDNAKNGISEPNMLKVKDDSAFQSDTERT